jgi:quercetin dioxygenase-like cupin family protein
MEYKRNEATLNRPEGDRVLDALYVCIDLPDFIRQLKEEPAWQKNDRNGITVFKTDQLTMVLTMLHKEAVIKDNVVDGLFTLQVIEGSVRISTIDGDVELKEKQLINLHANEPHSIEALSDAVLLLSNYTMPSHSSK